jgi:GTPase SAR1 family protein
VSRRDTFTNLEYWKEDFFLQAGIEPTKIDFPIVVLGNKVDLESRDVKTEEAEEWVRSLGSNVAYFETSAKDAKNVEQAFLYVAKKVAGKEVPEID